MVFKQGQVTLLMLPFNVWMRSLLPSSDTLYSVAKLDSAFRSTVQKYEKPQTNLT